MKPYLLRWSRRTAATFLFIFLLFPNLSMAKENDEDFLSQGLVFYEKNEFEKAIEFFKKAIQSNSNLEAAHLNLGIVYYSQESFDLALEEFQQVLERNPTNSSALVFTGLSLQGLEQYQNSISYFEKAGKLDEEFNQLSLFSIGKAHSQLGNNKEAADKLIQAINVDPTTDIGRASETLLKLLAEKKEKKPWTVSASTGFEYDDNVTVSEQDLTTVLSDFSYLFEFSGAYKILEAKKYELEAGYDLSQSIYDNLSAFDLQSHIFSLNGSYEFKKLNVGMLSIYNRTSLGADDFLEVYSISPSIGFSILTKWYATLNYSYNDTNYFNDPDRDSQNHGFSFDNFIFFMDGKGYVRINYRFENQITTGDEFAFLGNFLTAGVRFPPLTFFNLGTKINISYNYFFKDYKNVTASIGEKRKDFRNNIQLGINQPIYKKLDVKLDYQFIDGVSNLAASDFKENIVSLSLSVSF